MHEMISPGQLRKVWACARAIGWDDTRLHRELDRVIGVDSLRKLTAENAGLFIDYLVSEWPPSLRPAPPATRMEPAPKNLIELATPAQRDYIAGLLDVLGWTRDEAYFLGALKRANGTTKIRTRRDASRAIIFLEKMVEQRRKHERDSQDSPGAGSAS